MGTNCVLAYSWQYTLQPANIAYIVENGWQVMTEVYVESTLAPSQYSQYTLFIDTCEANGIPYWLDIEESMNQGEEGTNWYNILFPEVINLFIVLIYLPQSFLSTGHLPLTKKAPQNLHLFLGSSFLEVSSFK